MRSKGMHSHVQCNSMSVLLCLMCELWKHPAWHRSRARNGYDTGAPSVVEGIAYVSRSAGAHSCCSVRLSEKGVRRGPSCFLMWKWTRSWR